MLSIFYYTVRIGMSIGVAILDVGISMWIIGKINSAKGATRMAKEIVSGSIALLAITFLIRIW